MGKKKPARNAFYYFMSDYKDKNSNCKSMAEAAERAGPIWQNMSPAQKKPYEDLAKKSKNRGVKLTNSGVAIDIVAREEEAEVQKEFNMKSEIEKLINVASMSQALQEQNFYVAHVNDYFYFNADSRYFPAEIAIVGFNLRDGIIDTYHKIIVPEAIPLGYLFLAKENAEATHKIKVEIDATGTDMQAVLKEILSLIKRYDGSAPYHPLYFSNSIMAKATNIFDNMAFDAGYNRSMFDIYSVEYLFYALRNAVADDKVFATVGVADLELAKDVFEFTQGMACPFHESTDVPQMCSLSVALRTIYAICSHCCKDMGVSLVPGQHVPLNAVIRNTNSIKEEDESDTIRSLAAYDDDDMDTNFSFDTKEVDVKTDNESECGEFKTVKQRGRHYMYKYSSQESSLPHSSQNKMSQNSSLPGASSGPSGTSVAAGVRRPATVSKILSQNSGSSMDYPFLGSGRGRGYF